MSPPKSSTVSSQHDGFSASLPAANTQEDNADETNLLGRLQTATAEYQQIDKKLSKLNKLVNKVGGQEKVHDPVVMAAFRQQEEEGELIEAVPVSDSAIGSSDFCVVGEVVASSNVPLN